MKKIERIGIVIKPHAPDIRDLLIRLISFIEEKGLAVLLEDAAAEMLQRPEGIRREDIPKRVDMVVVLGGDGTLLSIAHLAAQAGVPVLGGNLGSLGFLTEVPREEIFLTIETFLAGNRSIVSPRQMLEVKTGEKTFLCLNDMVVHKGALARMIHWDIWVDDKKIATSRADGLIISTPTGSTAYSLSAGGPIVHPYLPGIVMTPICPHTFSFRPMIISSKVRIKIRLNTSGEKAYLTLDGQRGGKMCRGEILEVRTSRLKFKLISSPKRNYFDLLQEKLGWG